MPRLSFVIAIAGVALAASISAPACSQTEALNERPTTSPPILGAPDGSIDLPEAGFARYCPSSECPAGYTTCPNSAFRCDVNLLTDIANCGACGNSCPRRSNAEVYSCIEGRCALACDPTSRRIDCNGFVDDGCETDMSSNDNCGGCGIRCTDPTKPCTDQTGSGNYACGCPAGRVACADPWMPGLFCRDLRRDDENCGTCGSVCDPAGDGGPVYEHAAYGCEEAECGKPKCERFYADCDHDLPRNGCETPTWTDQNCGACGRACPAGQFCALQPIGGQIIVGCVCPGGLTFCGDRAASPADKTIGRCFDLTSDFENCGGCGLVCPGYSWKHATGSCEFGTCKMTCVAGWGDCNGNVEDDCETHTANDPRNCGGCGVVCNTALGQACVQGRCVVAPCDKDGGGPQ